MRTHYNGCLMKWATQVKSRKTGVSQASDISIFFFACLEQKSNLLAPDCCNKAQLLLPYMQSFRPLCGNMLLGYMYVNLMIWSNWSPTMGRLCKHACNMIVYFLQILAASSIKCLHNIMRTCVSHLWVVTVDVRVRSNRESMLVIFRIFSLRLSYIFKL